jgi:hypothetical protein
MRRRPVEAARAVKMWKTEKQVFHIYHKRVGKVGAAKHTAPTFPQAPTRPYYWFFLLLFPEEQNSQTHGLETKLLIVIEKRNG